MAAKKRINSRQKGAVEREKDRKRSLAYYHSHPEFRERQRVRQNQPHVRAQKNQWRRDHPEIRLCAAAKVRANQRGVFFSLTPSDVVVPIVCPCCNVTLTQGVKRTAPTAPSLDRLDNGRGYVPGNVWVICFRCNALKGDSVPQELRRIADAVDRRLQCL